LDSPHAAFALGLWMTGAPLRADRFKVLIAVAKDAYREWKIEILPFSRPIHDIISMLTRVRVAADGAPLAPASRALWARTFTSDDIGAAAAKWTGDVEEYPVDAAWLAQTIAAGDVPQRGDRLDQFSFGQRAFAAVGDGDTADLLVALRAFARYPMLALTLERLGIINPATLVAAARHASGLGAVDRRYGFTALAQFQGVLALVVRMRLVGTIDLQKADALVTSLTAVPIGEEGYGGGILKWIDREIRPQTPAAHDFESGLMARLAGVGVERPTTRVAWEGYHYRLDLAAAEERRLRRIRETQSGPPLDLALDIWNVARTLSESAAHAALPSAMAALKLAAAALPPATEFSSAAELAGTDGSRDPHGTIAKAIDDLGRAERSFDARTVATIAGQLMPLAEAIAADALLSLAYAVDIGDPEGTVLHAGHVARRHDFGLGIDDGAMRARAAWSMPKQNVAPGVPWHISGSALGLDVALAALGLRRVDTTRVADMPTLTSNERQTFAVSVALLNPFDLSDADRDAIAEAIARGRARVAAITPQSVDRLADEIAMDGWRRRALRWSLANDAMRTVSLFSLTEMLYLGGAPQPPGADRWGMAAIVSTGCVCTRIARPGEWRNLTGRPQLGLLSTAVVDVHLHVAVALRDLGLPAAIAKHVLSAAVQDYIDEVRPNDQNDWLTLVRGAQTISRERIEDYVAAITADGPLVPDTSSQPSYP
ncbi:MAG: hypothetical protein HY655_14650, partial [Acidobacteria bacterium]|nr:hypothetical protein [Acidobacteriota bacterium]